MRNFIAYAGCTTQDTHRQMSLWKLRPTAKSIVIRWQSNKTGSWKFIDKNTLFSFSLSLPCALVFKIAHWNTSVFFFLLFLYFIRYYTCKFHSIVVPCENYYLNLFLFHSNIFFGRIHTILKSTIKYRIKLSHRIVFSKLFTLENGIKRRRKKK